MGRDPAEEEEVSQDSRACCGVRSYSYRCSVPTWKIWSNMDRPSSLRVPNSCDSPQSDGPTISAQAIDNVLKALMKANLRDGGSVIVRCAKESSKVRWTSSANRALTESGEP